MSGLDYTLDEAREEFELARADDDKPEMARLSALIAALGGEPVTGITAHSGTGTRPVATLPTEIRLSTQVSRPGPPPRNEQDRHCDVCRCSFPGSDGRITLVDVRTASGTIKACTRCRERKGLTVA